MEYVLVVARSLAVENDALSLMVSAQNVEQEKLRAELTELPRLKEKLAKCKELSERLALTEKWSARINNQTQHNSLCSSPLGYVHSLALSLLPSRTLQFSYNGSKITFEKWEIFRERDIKREK